MKDLAKYKRYGERIPIFHGLSPEDVEYILHHGKTIYFQQGKTIFHEGQLGSNLFILLSGQIALYNKARVIAELKVGAAFGEMAVLNHKPRTATAVALTDTRLFTLDEKEINSLLEKRVAVRLLLNIIHVLSERLESTNALIAELRRPSQNS